MPDVLAMPRLRGTDARQGAVGTPMWGGHVSLREWFPEWHERDEWINANATRFKVSTMGMVEPDHPAIGVSIEAVNQDGSFTRAEAEHRVVELEESGIAAWFTPTRDEYRRLLTEWEARDVGE